MTNLLLKFLSVKDCDPEIPENRNKIGTLSGAVGIFCNLLLCLGKLLAGLISGSVSITADALNNLSDASASVVTLLGFSIAGKPADDEHPYGHARAEYLSALAVSALILLIGGQLAKSSVDKILHPALVEFSPLIAGILLCSIAVKFWMQRFNARLAQRIHSATLAATAQDSRNDCITTAAVLLAALAESFLQIPVDGYAGLAVSLFILWNGWALARETISPLLGENADPAQREALAQYISQQPKVLGYHDLMVHDYGPGQRFASIHVEMDHREDPLLCHELIDAIERGSLQSFGIHLVIHYDPVVVDDPELTALRERITAMLRIRDSRLSLHDFRMTQGKQHKNVIFDVSLPDDLTGCEGAIRSSIETALNTASAVSYHVHITFDRASFNG